MSDHTLAIGDRTYSSWSLRGWLLFEKFEIPVTVRSALMKTAAFSEMLADFGAAQTVPAMRQGDVVVTDSLAMAETLAETRDIMWPQDAIARGRARSLTAEMHASFGALRDACPMNLRRCYDGFVPDAAVLADVARLDELWCQAMRDFGDGGPWLFGRYSIADVFFAPAAMRIATYRLEMSTDAMAYVAAHVRDPAIRRWRAMGLAENHIRSSYEKDLPERPWPGPAAVPAVADPAARPINDACPFSGKPVVAEGIAVIDGRPVGFCNMFCRDKVIADPLAWPQVAAILQDRVD